MTFTTTPGVLHYSTMPTGQMFWGSSSTYIPGRPDLGISQYGLFVDRTQSNQTMASLMTQQNNAWVEQPQQVLIEVPACKQEEFIIHCMTHSFRYCPTEVPVSLRLMYPNTLPGDWEMVDDSIPLAPSALYMACAPKLRGMIKKTVFYTDFGMTSDMDELDRELKAISGHVVEYRTCE